MQPPCSNRSLKCVTLHLKTTEKKKNATKPSEPALHDSRELVKSTVQEHILTRKSNMEIILQQDSVHLPSAFTDLMGVLSMAVCSVLQTLSPA